MFGGFIILLDRPFRVGDRIQLEGGQAGDVLEIGIRSTRMLKLDHNVMIVPNAFLVRTMVTNVSLPTESAKLQLDVRVAPESDVAGVRKALLEAAVAQPGVLGTPAPVVIFRSFADAALSLQLVCHTASFTDQNAVLDGLNAAIFARLTAAGVRLALPAHEVLLRQPPAPPPPASPR